LLHDLYIVILYSLIIYFLLLILTRLMGRKLLSQMTYFDFVTGITIGTIGATFITVEVKGFIILLSPVILSLLVIATGYLTLKSVPARKILEGEPLVLIQNGKILEDNLKNVRYNIDDLMMLLREKKVFNMDEVEFAILEPNGKLSVQKKSQYLPVSAKDLNISTKYKGISSEMIRDGEIVHQNIEQNNLSYEWLYNQLQNNDIENIDDVFLATLSTEGTLYVDLKKDEPKYNQKVEDD